MSSHRFSRETEQKERHRHVEQIHTMGTLFIVIYLDSNILLNMAYADIPGQTNLANTGLKW